MRTHHNCIHVIASTFAACTHTVSVIRESKFTVFHFLCERKPDIFIVLILKMKSQMMHSPSSFVGYFSLINEVATYFADPSQRLEARGNSLSCMLHRCCRTSLRKWALDKIEVENYNKLQKEENKDCLILPLGEWFEFEANYNLGPKSSSLLW